MHYHLIKDLIQLVSEFEKEYPISQVNITLFSNWLSERSAIKNLPIAEPDWEGKAAGRSPESVINTMVLRMSRYARLYGKAVIAGTPFHTSDEFIYLINLKFSGPMSKTQLIKHNIQEKSAGIEIINRLLRNGWATQTENKKDRRNKILSITAQGDDILSINMPNIRAASKIVTGNLTHQEKMQLIRLLQKLDSFHEEAFLNDNILNAFDQTK